MSRNAGQTRKTRQALDKQTPEQFFDRLSQLMGAGARRFPPCPPESEIIDEALGALGKARSAKVRKHLVECQACLDQSLAVALAAAEAQQSRAPVPVPTWARVAIEAQRPKAGTRSWAGLWRSGLAAFDRAVQAALDSIFPESVSAVIAHASAAHHVVGATSKSSLRLRVPVRKQGICDSAGKLTLPVPPGTRDATLARIASFLSQEGRYAMAVVAPRPEGWVLVIEPSVFRSPQRLDPGGARRLLVLVSTRIRDVEEAAGELLKALGKPGGKPKVVQPHEGVAYVIYGIKPGPGGTGPSMKAR